MSELKDDGAIAANVVPTSNVKHRGGRRRQGDAVPALKEPVADANSAATFTQDTVLAWMSSQTSVEKNSFIEALLRKDPALVNIIMQSSYLQEPVKRVAREIFLNVWLKATRGTHTESECRDAFKKAWDAMSYPRDELPQNLPDNVLERRVRWSSRLAAISLGTSLMAAIGVVFLTWLIFHFGIPTQ